MPSFNSSGKCIEKCAVNFHLTAIRNSISLWTYKQLSLQVFTFSLLHRKCVSGLKNLENLQLSPPTPCKPQKPTQGKKTDKKELFSWTAGWWYFPDFIRLVSFSDWSGIKQKAKWAIRSWQQSCSFWVFLLSVVVEELIWEIYFSPSMTKQLPTHFFLRHKYPHKEVL